MKRNTVYAALSSFAALALAGALSAAGCAAPVDERASVAEEALTGDQCLYFDVNGKNTICHYTGSANKPYTLIKISDQACIVGHAGHAGDYVTSLDPASPLYDPTCNGQGCLPDAAPCDGTLDCCAGSCVDGHCAAPDPCASHPCLWGGECVPQGSSFYCICQIGFSGQLCEIGG